MKFTFKAIRDSGETYTGTAEAADRYALAHNVKEEGATLVSAEEMRAARKGPRTLLGVTFSFSKVKLRDKVLFARNLAAMLSAGLALSRALSVLERQTHNRRFKEVLEGIRGKIQQGRSFSEALQDFSDVFPPIFVSMVRAGEEGGNVVQALENLAIQMDKSYQLRRRVRGAMLYPSIVIGAMVIVGVVMLMFVVPTLTETFVELEIELPLSTRLVIGVSDFFQNNTLLALGIFLAFVVFVIVGVRRPRTRRLFEFVLLRVPIIGGLVRETNAARTTRTLASLLTSGVEVVTSLGITKDVLQNSYYRAVLSDAEERIQKGSAIAAPFLENDKLYPVLVGEMMSVGEEAGNLPEMLLRVAEFYEGEVEQKTKDMSTIIEPFLMIIIGMAVGFFALSMISPIYSISSGI
jgi:type IV pilus assembly protein PilC